MSTLKTTQIQHPDASSPNLTLAADGSVSGGAGLGGLVLLETRNLSASSSEAFDGIFTSTYDNYKIMISIKPSTSAGYLAFLLRSSSSDVTGNYNGSSAYVSTSTGGYTAQNYGTNSANIQLAYIDSGGSNFIDLNVSSPALTAYTNFQFNETYFNGTPIWGADSHMVAAAYDGIRFFPGWSATLTGTIRVYGYANS